jgi:MFS family permease
MNRRDALVAGLLSAGLVALLVPFARLGVDPHHDGIMLKPALDVLSGQVLFRDTFSQYGAMTTYLQVVALWLQPRLLSLKLLTVAAYAMTLFFLYASWRLILPRSLTILSCGLFILFIPAYEKNWLDQYWILQPWSSMFAMLFQSIALYALFRVIRGEQPVPWGLVLGVACACIFWCRQPVGVITAGCLVVIWLALHWTNWAPAGHSKRSILISILGGFTAVNALLLGSILLSGALPEWWYQNFVWPRKLVLESVNVSWKAFITVFVHPSAGAGLLVLGLAATLPALVKRYRANLSSRSLLTYYLCLGGMLAWQHERVLQVLSLRDGGWTVLVPLLVLLQAVISVTAAFATRNVPRTTEYFLVAALAALSLGSLVQYYPIPDSWHILWSLAPAFGLLAFVFWRGVGWPAPVVAVVLSAVFLPSLYVKAQSATQALTRPMVTLARPAVLRGMQVPPEQARSLSRIADCLGQILRRQPDMPAALIGDDALFLCFTPNHTNPTPYYVTWIGLADNKANEKRWNYILSVRPLMFLHKARWEAVDDFYRRARYVPLLYLPEEALEIAVPQELAETMGLTAYGATPPSGPAKEPLKP